ncbi:S8 family peptidase [Sediminitomix flava]|uniref:Putative secreted protein (Por secretion system target) n=1 Tax=Sediminitomix flava TaxID=379075 RepID=A0A315ZGT1_SEDFL|nr:S8 family peptidase [Sediminitomix flava]PWJ43944.1 putative secreted protein (Por secretion system target) [Sediminitomix flava]
MIFFQKKFYHISHILILNLFILQKIHSQTVQSIEVSSPNTLFEVGKGEINQAYKDSRKLKIYRRQGKDSYIVEGVKSDSILDSIGLDDSVKFYASNFYNPPNDVRNYLIQFSLESDFIQELQLNKIKYGIVKKYSEYNSYQLRLSAENLVKVQSLKSVTRIDIANKPLSESPLNELDLSVNQIQFLHHKFADFLGKEKVVAIKELQFNKEDIDLSDRSVTTNFEALETSNHATAMATLIGGAGNSFITGKGVAPKTSLASTSYENVFPDVSKMFSDLDVHVQNHSYGFDIANYYSLESSAYDQQVFENPEILHVFSAGNKGDSIPEIGTYKGIGNFANLSGKVKMAKNILLVGAHNQYYEVDLRSSRGPAYDGRLKPEIVAYGRNGSSDAAAYVSGTAILLKEAYQKRYAGSALSSLIKSLLITTAIDIENEGPDYISGYGRLDAERAMSTLINHQFFEDSLKENEIKSFSFSIPSDVSELKLSLVWTDPQANLGDYKALINDLDAVLKTNEGGQVLPWVLSSANHIDSLKLDAIRAEDHLNNVEYISVKKPTEGMYTIEVKSTELHTDFQKFSISYDYTVKDKFEWTYPTFSDPLESGKTRIVRWRNSFESKLGTLEVKWDNLSDEADSWREVKNDIDLNLGYYEWFIPEVTSIGQLRMKVENEYFYSDEFTVNPIPNLNFAVNCDDRFILAWDSISNIESYEIAEISKGVKSFYSLEKENYKYFEKRVSIPETFSLTPYFKNERRGLSSYAVDLNTQFSSCYISSFLVKKGENDLAHLSLELGSILGVKEVHFERVENGFSEVLSIQDNIEETLLNLSIPLEGTGRQVFRASIILEDESLILSDEASILFTQEKDLIVYPNPVLNQYPIYIQSSNQPKTFTLYNLYGKAVFQTDLLGEIDEIFLPNLSEGVYVFQVLENGTFFNSGRIIIQKDQTF